MRGESREANGTDAPHPCDSGVPTQIRTVITRVRSPAFTDRQLPDLFEAPADRRLHHGVERAGESHRQLWLDWMQEERSRPPCASMTVSSRSVITPSFWR
jgi:hypothetical protein